MIKTFVAEPGDDLDQRRQIFPVQPAMPQDFQQLLLDRLPACHNNLPGLRKRIGSLQFRFFVSCDARSGKTTVGGDRGFADLFTPV